MHIRATGLLHITSLHGKIIKKRTEGQSLECGAYYVDAAGETILEYTVQS